MGQLISFDRMNRQLALATDIDEIKELRDKAEVLRLYAKKAGEGLKQQNQCAEIKIRAERRCGELLPNKIKHGGDRKSKSRLVNQTLKDLGISKYLSYCWQSIARIPDDVFEEFITKAIAKNKELTSASLLRIAKEYRKKDKNLWKTIIPSDLPSITERYQLINQSFQNVDLESDSIDIIITDPPYDKQHIFLYKDLAKFASDVLKPGGSLLVISGLYYLPEILALMLPHISYHWTLAYQMPGSTLQMWQRKVMSCWKPVIWFVKEKYKGDWIKDTCKSSGPDKEHHKLGQSETGMADLIEKFTYPGQTICDPMCGAGTIGVVALNMNRTFIGIDIDNRAIETAKKRLFGKKCMTKIKARAI